MYTVTERELLLAVRGRHRISTMEFDRTIAVMESSSGPTSQESNMQIVVIAMEADRLTARVADGARRALELDRKFRDAGYERVTFTNGETFFHRERLEAMSDITPT